MDLDAKNTLDGWHNGDNDRSSWTILWSCMATIFVCTWTVLHLNVPPRGTSEHQNLLRKLRWLVITAVAPEIITSYAFGEYLHARHLLAELQRDWIAPTSWTLAHAFYLSMGSMNFRTSDGHELPFCKRKKTSDGWEVPWCNPDIITLKSSKILSYPDITRLDIQDRSKDDHFSKALTVLQTSWFAINTITRAARAMPICPLELSCMAYVVCTCVTYGFWWSKPRDVLTTLIVPCSFAISDLPTETQASIKTFNPVQRVRCHQRWRGLRFSHTETEVLNVIRGRIPAVVGLFTGVAFCAIHLVAWEFPFPSRVEAILWRLSCVATAAIPLICLVIIYVRSLAPVRFDAMWALVLAIYCTFIALYAAARLTVIAILFSTLRNLPAGSYVSINWAKIIPHL